MRIAFRFFDAVSILPRFAPHCEWSGRLEGHIEDLLFFQTDSLTKGNTRNTIRATTPSEVVIHDERGLLSRGKISRRG